MDLIEKTGNIIRHPWELSRSAKMLNILKENDKSTNYADIGAGDRFFTSKILSITNGKVYAIDTEYDNKISTQNDIICLNNISLLEKDSVDCIILMDVLEHIDDEKDFLKNVLDKIKPGGMVLITVPALQSLFSVHDHFLRHYRRYNRNNLKMMLNISGVKIEKIHYFYTILLIPRLLTVLMEKLFPEKMNDKKGIGQWKHKENNPITRTIYTVLNIDYSINKLLNALHIWIPGLSLLAVCRKRD